MAIPKRTNIAPMSHVHPQFWQAVHAALAGKIAAGTITNAASVSAGELDDMCAIADAVLQGVLERYTAALP